MDNRWIWDTEAGTHIPYDIPNDIWKNQLQDILQTFETSIYLVITDDEFFPWPVIECSSSDLIEILEAQIGFEYFIFDQTMNQVLFDTHHNEFVLLGPLEKLKPTK